MTLSKPEKKEVEFDLQLVKIEKGYIYIPTMAMIMCVVFVIFVDWRIEILFLVVGLLLGCIMYERETDQKVIFE